MSVSLEERELEALVEVIARRVEERLSGRGPSSSNGRAAANVDAEDCECETCVVTKPWSIRAIEEASPNRIATTGHSPAAMPKTMAKLIDHTLLKQDATREEVQKLCEEARTHSFASVCVNTSWVPFAHQLLSGSGVMVCAVVGFPLGAMTPGAKAYEARDAVRQGADEIDMVLNVGALKSRDYETVFEDICKVVKASHPAAVKVILETGALTDEEKIIGCALSKLAGAAFVKTSTGFGKGGATTEDVALMRRIVGADMGVKASGGVRSREDANRMTQAGANRIGASASIAIVSTAEKGGAKDSGGAKGGY